MPIEYQFKCRNCGSCCLCRNSKPGILHCNHCGSDFAVKPVQAERPNDRAHAHKDDRHLARKSDEWKPKKKKKLKKKKKSGWLKLAEELVDLID